MVAIKGDEKVTLVLTVDQVSFIVSGLRDCAVAAYKRYMKAPNTTDARVESDIQQENVELADLLERTYLSQLRG